MSSSTTTNTDPNSSTLLTASVPPHALPHGDEHIALLGLGAIGISFLALHLTYTSAIISIYDPRPDLQEHVANVLPLYLPSPPTDDKTDHINQLTSAGRLRFCASLEEAVQPATIVQEQGPENLPFKQKTWSEVLRHVGSETHLWSSTSGIPASQQLAHLDAGASDPAPSLSPDAARTDSDDTGLSRDTIRSARARLLVVHPFNPPHLASPPVPGSPRHRCHQRCNHPCPQGSMLTKIHRCPCWKSSLPRSQPRLRSPSRTGISRPRPHSTARSPSGKRSPASSRTAYPSSFSAKRASWSATGSVPWRNWTTS